MCKRIATLFLTLLIALAIFSTSISVARAQAPPDPWVMKPIYVNDKEYDPNNPPSINLGETVKIRVAGINYQGGDASEAYLGVSFPDLTSTSSYVRITSSNAPNYKAYQPGSSGWGGYGTKQLTLKYWLVEAWAAPWRGGKTWYWMEVVVKPEKAGPFTFHVKMTAKGYDGKWYADPTPSGQGKTGGAVVLEPQQSEYAYACRIDVKSTGNLAVQCLDVNGNPAPNVEVKLYKPEPWTFLRSQRADSSGRTTFTNLEPGYYYIKYVPSTPWKIKDDGIIEIGTGRASALVKSGETTSWSVKEAGLEVYVKDQGGNPVQGAEVLLYIMEQGKYQRFLEGSNKITGSDGKVVYRYLDPTADYWTAYVVEVYKDGKLIGRASKEIGAGWNSVPITVVTNNPPQLSAGYVDPKSGDTSTNFYYYVNYYDADGDKPTTRYVYIDGIPYTMSLYGGSEAAGVYRYGPKTLTAGYHTYYFYFEDGRGGSARLPMSGSCSGPTVGEEVLPDLTITSVKAYPSTLYIGEWLTVEFTGANIGKADSSVFGIGIYLGKTENGTDYFLYEPLRTAFKAGETKPYKYEVRIPENVEPGDYYVTVFIDHKNEVKESNENNNIGSTTPNKITVKVREMHVHKLSPKGASYHKGDPVTVSIEIVDDYGNPVSGAEVVAMLTPPTPTGTTAPAFKLVESTAGIYSGSPLLTNLQQTGVYGLNIHIRKGDYTASIYDSFEIKEGTTITSGAFYGQVKHGGSIVKSIQIPAWTKTTEATTLKIFLQSNESDILYLYVEPPDKSKIYSDESSSSYKVISISSPQGGIWTIRIFGEKVVDDGAFIGGYFYETTPFTFDLRSFKEKALAFFIKATIKKVFTEVIGKLLGKSAGIVSGVVLSVLDSAALSAGNAIKIYTYTSDDKQNVGAIRVNGLLHSPPVVISDVTPGDIKLEALPPEGYVFNQWKVPETDTDVVRVEDPKNQLTYIKVLAVDGLSYSIIAIFEPSFKPSISVQPTTWSDIVEAGKSKTQTFTTSASGGTVRGVTVTKISGPAWLTISPTSLGDIQAGSSKTFTVTASPPAGTTGSFSYLIRVTCTEGEPKSIDVSGTITVKDVVPPTPVEVKVEPSETVRDDYEGNIRLKVLWKDDSGVSRVKFELWADSTPIGVKDPDGKDTDEKGNGWYWYDIPRVEWSKYLGKKIYWHSVAWDPANNPGDTRILGPISIVHVEGKKPDLVVEKIDMLVYGRPEGSNATEGDNVEFRVKVKNIGAVSAPPGWYVDYYLDGKFVKRDGPATIGVGPGAAVVSAVVWNAPEGSAGTHTLTVKVDSTNAVDEGDEANNEKSLVFFVEPAGGIVKGDLNNDGKIDAADLVLMKKIVLGLKPSVDFNKDGKIDNSDYVSMMRAADMDGDGKVNAVDLVLLKRKVLAGGG